MPLETLDTERYLGKWYEIARLDFFFERGLSHTSAEYSLNPRGYLNVVNRGWDGARGKWKEARGKARFRYGEPNGALEVSFFGPFYSEYNIISLDGDYQYALILGDTPGYLWILSRSRSVPEDIRAKYLDLAQGLGVRTEELIWVDQNPLGPGT